MDPSLPDSDALLHSLDLTTVDPGALDPERRRFIYFSLVGAAASVLGAAGARGQAAPATSAAASPQAVPPALPPLGNAEAPALQFMPHPAGTGALLEQLVAERGAAAFKRGEFKIEPWRGPVPSDPADLAFLPAHRQSALLRARKITSLQLTEIYLARLKRYNPSLLCAVTILEDQARAEARRADAEIAAGKYRGPLHGIPYGIKDLFATRGAPTTWGAPDFQQQVIDLDAEVVIRLREAGAVLLAKLATGIFAQNDNWFRGRTNNPWNPVLGSSGSSAGPGSATAAGLVAFAIGTETQGSITSPSLRNGLCALRPTFGRVSRHGGMVLSWSQDRVGPMCRSVEDCAMVFHAIHGADPKDASTITTPFHYDRRLSLRALRIGYDAAAPAAMVARLRELGAQPVEIAARPRPQDYGLGGGLNVEYAAAFDFFVTRKAAEFGVDLNALVDPSSKPGGPSTPYGTMPSEYTGSPMAPANWNPRFVNGRTVRGFEFVNQQRRRLQYLTAYQAALGDLDLFVSSAPAWDVAANAQTGNPCAVVPYAFEVPPVPNGQPADLALKPQPICGILVGALYKDDVLLSVAHQLEQAYGMSGRRPELT